MSRRGSEVQDEDELLDMHMQNLGLRTQSARTSARISNRVSQRVASHPSHKERSDSDLARELQTELDLERPEADSGDEEYARQVELEEERRRRSRRSAGSSHRSRREQEDVALAHTLVAMDQLEYQERMQAELDRLDNLDGDYHNPKEYKPTFCYMVIALCSIMMFIEIAVNDWEIEPLLQNPTLGPSVETLLKLGAKSTELILAGQFYRLYTPMFLHAGILHLLFNMMGLVNIGIPLEREFGSLKIAVIFFCSGVFGVLLSAIFLPQQTGVGASGAIFGLFGSAWSDLIHNWTLYRGTAKSALCQLTFATVINLMIGLLPLLDNFAHVGGFICGLFLGFTMLVQNTYDIWGFRKARKSYQLAIQAASITIVPVLFVALMLVLYLQVDVSTACTWCSYISCVPLPPGVPDEEKWWDCSECSMTALSVVQDGQTGAYTITCPQGNSVYVPAGASDKYTIAGFKENDKLIIGACKQFCYA